MIEFFYFAAIFLALEMPLLTLKEQGDIIIVTERADRCSLGFVQRKGWFYENRKAQSYCIYKVIFRGGGGNTYSRAYV